MRRLVSEGTRLRLPWAPRVSWLDEHPERVLALLELLKDDPATVVRRSVANNLNDLGKVHPALLLANLRALAADASAERRALVEHALRSAVKRGSPEALATSGIREDRRSVGVEGVHIAPRRVAIGGRVSIAFVLRSHSRVAQELLVDLAVHFVKARGRPARKVFKLKRLVVPARGVAALSTSVSLAVHTTRKPQPGRHAVDVIVNGHSMSIGSFQVVRAK